MTPVLAAAYARMSTEHQKYSIENQLQIIHEYAQKQGMEITHTYLDRGKRGLTLAHRAGLQALLADARSGKATYSVVLVYDVSRWGRFQNTDEAAFYEFTCQLAGIRVIYCAEGFEGYGAMMAALAKSMKRAMAGEYSRELSGKSWRSCSNLVRRGFKMGGTPGFGFRRMLLDESGQPRALLEAGQHKALQSERVVLVYGPRTEVEIVWQIFDLYAHTELSVQKIADLLNLGAVPPKQGVRWDEKWVRRILSSPKYSGDYVWNRSSRKLGDVLVQNPPEEWVHSEQRIRPLVTPELFELARRKAHVGARPKYSVIRLRTMLRELLAKKQHLSTKLIKNEYGVTQAMLEYYFGSLRKAYEAAGYCPLYWQDIKRNREAAEEIRDRLAKEIVAHLGKDGVEVKLGPESGFVTIEGRILYIKVARSHRTRGKGYCWWVVFPKDLACNQFLLVGLDRDNRATRSYFLAPRSAMAKFSEKVTFTTRTIETYRVSGIKELCYVLRSEGAQHPKTT